MNLDPFYPIFDSADWLERMLPLGVKLAQLRVKDRPEADVAREIARARKLCAEAGCVLVINDYWRLAIAEGCDFIHLGQEDLDEADLDAIRAAGLKLGVSSHDEAELDRARRTMQAKQEREQEKLQDRIVAARDKYELAMRAWRAD